MKSDPIVEEVHRIRERMWDECGGDLDRLIALFRASEAGHPERIISGKQLTQSRREAQQPTSSSRID